MRTLVNRRPFDVNSSYTQTYVLALAQYLLDLRRGVRNHLFGSNLPEKAIILVAGLWTMLSKSHLLSELTANAVKSHRNSIGLSAHDQGIAIDDTSVDPTEIALSPAKSTLVSRRVEAGHDRVRASDLELALRETLRIDSEIGQGDG